MSKRIMTACLMFSLLLTGLAFAGNNQKDLTATGEKVFTGRAEYQNIRMLLNFVADTMTGLELNFQNARVSPMIRTEHWYECPMELSWMGTQDTLVPLLEKLLAYSFADSRLSHGAINVSCSAETRNDGQVILSITSLEKLICFDGAEKSWESDPKEFWASVSKRNQQIIRAFQSLLKTTTFNPLISKKILGGGIAQGKTWITNLRIDSDNRLNITGYALDIKQVTQFGEDLLKTGSFVEVYLHSMNKNVYEKTPVWRFDFTAKVN